ncbi:MAG: hypothetical protein AAGI06_01965, partial [Pseudomonadota bacterium]
DLPSLQAILPVGILHKNPTISAQQLRDVKLETGPVSAAMEELLSMMTSYTHEILAPPDFPGISWTSFWNTYQTDFSDTNNLSMVTFLNCNGTKILIPGDVETEGWIKLLSNENFCRNLYDVNVFIASHHGRENGYCEDVFDICNPVVFIFSDGPKKYATQEMRDVYASHASGIVFNGNNRQVLTTRSDGTLSWNL